jgi:hypothetical protein
MSDPILNCWGRMEQSYLKLKDESMTVLMIKPQDWPEYMYKYTLPRDDSVFSMRTKDQRSWLSAILGQKIEKRLLETVKTSFYF